MRITTWWVGLVALASPATAQSVRVDLTGPLARVAAELRAVDRQLTGPLAAGLARLGRNLEGLSGLDQLGHLGHLDQLDQLDRFDRFDGRRTFSTEAPSGWDAQDPADSTYRAARSALNRGNFSRAAELFNQVYERHAKSSYAADAYYYHAYALYRLGGTTRLREALEILATQEEKHEDATTRGDARGLSGRIRAELARRGDERSARAVAEIAEAAATAEAEPSASPSPSARTGRAGSGRVGRTTSRDRCGKEDDDEKSAALEALLTMDGDRALPLLERIMARRDAGSICLRRRAVFLISQHEGDEAERMLLGAARSDPDSEVRENAVFWLGQSGGEAAVSALDSILRGSTDGQVRDKAIFALAQTSSPRAMRILRDFAQQPSAPMNLRENAIFWLGQSGSGDNVEFLQSIYRATKEREIKDKIIFAVAQNGRRDGGRWLAGIVTDEGESVEARKSALFWLGQSGGSLSELFTLYDRLKERELRDQMIWVYSQRSEKAAVDKLLQIAKSDPDRDLRKKALFWLSQSRSKDPRVAELLEEILTKP